MMHAGVGPQWSCLTSDFKVNKTFFLYEYSEYNETPVYSVTHLQICWQLRLMTSSSRTPKDEYGKWKNLQNERAYYLMRWSSLFDKHGCDLSTKKLCATIFLPWRDNYVLRLVLLGGLDVSPTSILYPRIIHDSSSVVARNNPVNINMSFSGIGCPQEGPWSSSQAASPGSVRNH